MTQAIQNTDFFILREFREAAAALKPQIEGKTREERLKALSGFVAPYLKRLENNGWPQRERMLTLVKVWDEV